LKAGAVPTIFERPASDESMPPMAKRRRTAFEKRERSRVRSLEIL
jgi:hypothetical protein